MALLSASSHLTSILLWSLLPSFLSSILLRIFYALSPSSQPRVPPNPTPQQLAHENYRAREHSRRARILLVAGYLVWTLLNCYWEQGGINSNYYTLLGIERELVEEEGASAVKSRWRRLARVYHPDKVGKEGEAFFVLLRRGVDVLENEGKRWGYERFGPDVVEWGKLVTNREFLVRGVQGSAAFYVFALGSIMAVSFFRKDERAYNFWRYLALALTLFTELHLILRPSPSPLFSLLLPSRLPYQHIAFLRQLFISCSMALSQLAPLLFPPTASNSPASDPNATPEEQAAARALADAETLRPLLQRLALLTAQADAETVALQQQEMRPLFVVGVPAGETKSERREREERTVEEVKKGMRRTFEDLQIKSNPATAEVWAKAVRKGRAAAEKAGGGGARKREKGEKTGNGSANPFSTSTSTSSSSSNSGASTPSSLLLPSSNPFTLRSPSPSPSFTAATTSLASPPSSPKLSFTVLDPAASTSTTTDGDVVSTERLPLPETPVKRLAKDVPLPPSPADSVDGDGEVLGNGVLRENGSAKVEDGDRPDARRLQSPPPE